MSSHYSEMSQEVDSYAAENSYLDHRPFVSHKVTEKKRRQKTYFLEMIHEREDALKADCDFYMDLLMQLYQSKQLSFSFSYEILQQSFLELQYELEFQKFSLAESVQKGHFKEIKKLISSFKSLIYAYMETEKFLKAQCEQSQVDPLEMNLKPENILSNDHQNFIFVDILFQEQAAQYWRADGKRNISNFAMKSRNYLIGLEEQNNLVWQFANLLYFMCSGKLPFQATNLGQTKRNIVRMKYADLPKSFRKVQFELIDPVFRGQLLVLKEFLQKVEEFKEDQPKQKEQESSIFIKSNLESQAQSVLLTPANNTQRTAKKQSSSKHHSQRSGTPSYVDKSEISIHEADQEEQKDEPMSVNEIQGEIQQYSLQESGSPNSDINFESAKKFIQEEAQKQSQQDQEEDFPFQQASEVREHEERHSDRSFSQIEEDKQRESNPYQTDLESVQEQKVLESGRSSVSSVTSPEVVKNTSPSDQKEHSSLKKKSIDRIRQEQIQQQLYQEVDDLRDQMSASARGSEYSEDRGAMTPSHGLVTNTEMDATNPVLNQENLQKLVEGDLKQEMAFQKVQMLSEQKSVQISDKRSGIEVLNFSQRASEMDNISDLRSKHSIEQRLNTPSITSSQRKEKSKPLANFDQFSEQYQESDMDIKSQKQWETESNKASLYGKDNMSEMSHSVASSSAQQTPFKQSFVYKEQPSTAKKQPSSDLQSPVIEVGFDQIQDEPFREQADSQILFLVPLNDLRLLAITSQGGIYLCSYRNQDTELKKKRIMEPGTQIKAPIQVEKFTNSKNEVLIGIIDGHENASFSVFKVVQDGEYSQTSLFLVKEYQHSVNVQFDCIAPMNQVYFLVASKQYLYKINFSNSESLKILKNQKIEITEPEEEQNVTVTAISFSLLPQEPGAQLFSVGRSDNTFVVLKQDSSQPKPYILTKYSTHHSHLITSIQTITYIDKSLYYFVTGSLDGQLRLFSEEKLKEPVAQLGGPIYKTIQVDSKRDKEKIIALCKNEEAQMSELILFKKTKRETKEIGERYHHEVVEVQQAAQDMLYVVSDRLQIDLVSI